MKWLVICLGQKYPLRMKAEWPLEWVHSIVSFYAILTNKLNAEIQLVSPMSILFTLSHGFQSQSFIYAKIKDTVTCIYLL